MIVLGNCWECCCWECWWRLIKERWPERIPKLAKSGAVRLWTSLACLANVTLRWVAVQIERHPQHLSLPIPTALSQLRMPFTAESMDSSAETKTALVRTPSPGTYIPGDEAEASGSTAAQSPRHTRFRGDTIAISDQPHISDEGRTSLGGTLRRKLTAMSTPDRKIKDAPNISQQIKSIIMASCKSCYALINDARSDNFKRVKCFACLYSNIRAYWMEELLIMPISIPTCSGPWILLYRNKIHWFSSVRATQTTYLAAVLITLWQFHSLL